MINSARNSYLFAVLTVILFSAAMLCFLTDNALDIFFSGAGIFFSVIAFKEHRKRKAARRLRLS